MVILYVFHFITSKKAITGSDLQEGRKYYRYLRIFELYTSYRLDRVKSNLCAWGSACLNLRAFFPGSKKKGGFREAGSPLRARRRRTAAPDLVSWKAAPGGSHE